MLPIVGYPQALILSIHIFCILMAWFCHIIWVGQFLQPSGCWQNFWWSLRSTSTFWLAYPISLSHKLLWGFDPQTSIAKPNSAALLLGFLVGVIITQRFRNQLVQSNFLAQMVPLRAISLPTVSRITYVVVKQYWSIWHSKCQVCWIFAYLRNHPILAYLPSAVIQPWQGLKLLSRLGFYVPNPSAISSILLLPKELHLWCQTLPSGSYGCY